MYLFIYVFVHVVMNAYTFMVYLWDRFVARLSYLLKINKTVNNINVPIAWKHTRANVGKMHFCLSACRVFPLFHYSRNYYRTG